MGLKRYSLLGAVALAMVLAPMAGTASAAATNWYVDDGGLITGDGTLGNPYPTIQQAINAASHGDCVFVAAGTYVENVVLNKALSLFGAQAGIDARGRAASESTIAPASAIGINLQVPSLAGVVTIDGFTITGGTRGIESTSGDHPGMFVVNNRVLAFTNAGMFFNRNGPNMTVDQNYVDASSKLGGGGIVHFDTDDFDGLHFTNNTVEGTGNGTGFFVDGNENVGPSALPRNPLIDGNVLDGADTGMNLGSRAFDTGLISNNTFSNNVFDGLQGGIQFSTIENNIFDGNGRNGLALTSFGNPAADRGAQDTEVLDNLFTGNGLGLHPITSAPLLGAGISFSSAQSPGTISTNEAHGNNIDGNAMGARYLGSETVNVECNWWGHLSGPGGPDGPGSGDGADGANLDFTPWLTAAAPGGPCDGPLSQMDLKQMVRDELNGMLPTGDEQDDDRIEKAIEHLDKSLDAELWVSEERLDPKKGDKVFKEERLAVKELMKVEETDVSGPIDTILDIDRQLALTAIDDAEAATVVNPSNQTKVDNEIAKANAEMTKGDDARTDGDFDDAVKHYGNAWEHAQKAIKEAAKP